MVITINADNRQIAVELERGDTLLDAINKAGIEGFDAPCGGKGTCGKCRVSMIKSNTGNTGANSPDTAELKALSEEEVASGVRLACRVFPESDSEISISTFGGKAVIQSAFAGVLDQVLAAGKSICRRINLELPPPAIDDQRSDFKRIADALASSEPSLRSELPLRFLKELPSLLRKNDFRLQLTVCGDSIINITGVNTADTTYAAAVDIGTTTVVTYLVVLDGEGRGEVVDYVSGLNSQKGYGGDVVSRIEYCMQDEGNLEELHDRISGQITSMVLDLSARNKLEPNQVALLCVAGNTTMTHIFAGLDPKGIAAAPFIPVLTETCSAPAGDFGLDLPDGCECIVLPGIASYVGSDITAGIAATAMHESDELCLLIDIGTNGEIVLGNKHGLTACSTAAGPALEGANISCGMGGIPGAINSLAAVEEGETEVFSFNVIDDAEPRGICGSGIVDAIALFVESGIVDETGRILDEAELIDAGVHRSWRNCIIRQDGFPAVRIAGMITITQQDIREIQMAKGAIAAGVKTLLSETGKTAADIGRLYIAGGFGSAMNKHAAAVIGLFPSELEDVVEIAGNTAGKGAVMSALSEKVLLDMKEIAGNVHYIELSTSALFQQEYMTAMYF